MFEDGLQIFFIIINNINNYFIKLLSVKSNNNVWKAKPSEKNHTLKQKGDWLGVDFFDFYVLVIIKIKYKKFNHN